MISEYLGCSYEDFPESTAMSDGINIIPRVDEEVSCRVLCDEIYRIVDGKALHLQVIIPTQDKNDERRFPLVIYVQGSGWEKQCRGKELAQLCRFAQRGYVVAIVEYRHSEWSTFPAQCIDTKYAIDYMVTHAGEYHVDKEKLILWGDSSGAHTVLITAFTKGNEKFLENSLKEYKISGVVGYYPPSDLTKMNDEPSALEHCSKLSPEGKLFGGVSVDSENSKEANLINYVSEEKSIPPTLLIAGSKDRTVPFAQTVYLYDKMKACKKDVTCYQIKGADHGGEPFWTKAVLDIVEDFVKKSLYN